MTNLPVKFRIQRINEAIQNLRVDFAEYIKDKSYPLQDRWEAFVFANSELSGHASFYPDIPVKEGQEVSWYDDFYKDRYAYIDMVDVVASVMDSEDLQKKIDVTELKEWILENNLKSAINDW